MSENPQSSMSKNNQSSMSKNNQSSMSDISNSRTALKTLYNAVLNTVDSHEDNPQLLLFIGITLNDVDIVKKCMEYENLDANKGITGRNKHILKQFGCNFDDPIFDQED